MCYAFSDRRPSSTLGYTYQNNYFLARPYFLPKTYNTVRKFKILNENLYSWALLGPLKLNRILIISFTKISLNRYYIFETFLMSSN